MLNFNRSISLVLGSLLLAACSSGGGGGGGGTVAPPAEITSVNAPTIAGAVMASSLEGGELGGFAGFGPIMSAPPADSALVLAKVGELQSSHVDSIKKRAQTGIMEVPFSEPTTCSGGGMVTISGDLQNPETLTMNDTITFDFDMCVEADSTVDGIFAMTITSFSGDLESGAFSFGVRVDLTAFQIMADGVTVTASGDISMTIDATSAPALTTTVASNSLTITSGGSSHTLSGYLHTESFDSASGVYGFEVDGTLTSSAFSGSVTFETTEPFLGDGVSAFPYDGELVITGADGATITVTVVDATTVVLVIDLDGDGMADEPDIVTTWDELIQS